MPTSCSTGGGSGRSIVNRSYYAMFYGVLGLLQAIHRTPRKHAGAISLFDSEYVRTGLFDKESSRDLHQAFARRQLDDYTSLEPVPETGARDAAERAGRFVRVVEAYLRRTGYLDEAAVEPGWDNGAALLRGRSRRVVRKPNQLAEAAARGAAGASPSTSESGVGCIAHRRGRGCSRRTSPAAHGVAGR